MTGGGLVRSGGQPEMGPHTHTDEHPGNHELFGDMHQNQADHGDFLLLLQARPVCGAGRKICPTTHAKLAAGARTAHRCSGVAQLGRGPSEFELLK